MIVILALGKSQTGQSEKKDPNQQIQTKANIILNSLHLRRNQSKFLQSKIKAELGQKVEKITAMLDYLEKERVIPEEVPNQKSIYYIQHLRISFI